MKAVKTKSPSIAEIHLGTCVKVKWPISANTETLIETDNKIDKHHYLRKNVVRKIIRLSECEYFRLSNTLMSDRPSMFEGIGGIELPSRYEHLVKGFGFLSQERLKVFRTYGEEPVVMVTNGHDMFFVNTEGRNYAKYVGRIV